MANVRPDIPKDPREPSGQELEELSKIAVRIAKSRTRRERDLGRSPEAIANEALLSLFKAMKKEEIRSPEAFLTWKIKRLIIDAGMSRKVESERLKVHGHEIQHVNVVDGDVVDGLPRGAQFVGLSIDFISKEEEKARALVASAIIAIMPDPSDKELLRDRFYSSDLTIADLARKHGGKSPNAMANYLKRILGNLDEPGAVECVSYVVGDLSLKTAREFTRILSSLEELNLLTDPIGAAVGHLEFMSTKSPSHRTLAAKGVARLGWMSRHQPPNRKLSDKLLNRLILAACFYVLEANDARHDQFDELGLVDDVKVLDAVYHAIRKFSTD